MHENAKFRAVGRVQEFTVIDLFAWLKRGNMRMTAAEGA